MPTPTTRCCALALATAIVYCTGAPAYADPISDALTRGIVIPASNGLKRAVAQVPTGRQEKPVSQQVGLPTGFGYTADVSVAYPYGNIGKVGKGWLPGGVDLIGAYGFNPTTRAVVSYYEVQHYPVNFNSGTVPLYLQGFATPIGQVDLSTLPLSAATKDRFLILNFEKMFFLPAPGGKKLPIVVTPTYVARWSKIAASTTNDDRLAFEPNPPNGFPITGVYTRTSQVYSLAVTIPYLKTPKMFGTFTIAPTRMVHKAGLNQDNNTQLYQIGYLEYTPNDRLKFTFEPQSTRTYIPIDRYPEHNFVYFLGAAERIGKSGFVQALLSSGGPTNVSPYGITALTCQALPCSQNPVVPTIGGVKATQIQLQFGVGSPSLIPF